MKLTIVYDAEDEQGQDILSYLKEKSTSLEMEVRFFNLGNLKTEPCTGCFNCWVKTPGVCIFKDDASSVLREEIRSDRVLYLCPVTWGSYSPAMKIYQDRSLPRILPFFKTVRGETHHPHRYKKSPVPYLAGYGTDLSEDETSLFEQTGANLNDNIHDGDMNTYILQGPEDLNLLDRFFADPRV